MINEVSYVAHSRTKTARYVLFGLMATAAIFVAAAFLAPNYSGLIWVVALCFITASIYVYNRYVGAEYRYSVTNEGGRPTFTVGLRVGKTVRELAVLDLNSIIELKKMTYKEYREYKAGRGIEKFPYFPTMFPETLWLVCVRSEYENADFFIEIDEAFAEALGASDEV